MFLISESVRIQLLEPICLRHYCANGLWVKEETVGVWSGGEYHVCAELEVQVLMTAWSAARSLTGSDDVVSSNGPHIHQQVQSVWILALISHQDSAGLMLTRLWSRYYYITYYYLLLSLLLL